MFKPPLLKSAIQFLNHIHMLSFNKKIEKKKNFKSQFFLHLSIFIARIVRIFVKTFFFSLLFCTLFLLIIYHWTCLLGHVQRSKEFIFLICGPFLSLFISLSMYIHKYIRIKKYIYICFIWTYDTYIYINLMIYFTNHFLGTINKTVQFNHAIRKNVRGGKERLWGGEK